MIEAQAGGVKELATEQALFAETVKRIPNDGTADERHVDANLVGASGEQLDAHERPAIFESLDDGKLTHGGLAITRDGDFLAVSRITGKRHVDASDGGF